MGPIVHAHMFSGNTLGPPGSRAPPVSLRDIAFRAVRNGGNAVIVKKPLKIGSHSSSCAGQGQAACSHQRGTAMNRGKWSQSGVPHKGWTLAGFEDLGGLDGTCEMCETQSIRYVHHMEHPEYASVLGAGRVCASHMEEDYEAAHGREKKAKNLSKRRANWMSTEWKESSRGNHYINRQGFNTVLFRRNGCWAYRIEERESGQKWPKSGFATEDDAKLAAFKQFIALQEQ